MQSSKFKFGRDGLVNAPNAARPPFVDQNNQIFSFGNGPPPLCSVCVENIPDQVNRNEIVALFSTLIGEVRSFQVRDHALEIAFASKDAALKALCMNGYSIAGQNIVVNIMAALQNNTRPQKGASDDRRNLYVLGLPFALNKGEFTAMFAKFGNVAHSVILATVDNSSRRRGFVVMSSHEEAKAAMVGLTRTQVKGNTIDVSWAVVQRSQGFLDGGDRSILLDPRTNLPSSSPKLQDYQAVQSPEGSDTSGGSQEVDLTSMMGTVMPTQFLFVSNLPTLLFSQAQDLHPLFAPYGHIEKLEIVQVFAPGGTMAVSVQYSSVASAQEAKEFLQGQVYGDQRLNVRFAAPPRPRSSLSARRMSTSEALGNDSVYSLGTYDHCALGAREKLIRHSSRPHSRQGREQDTVPQSYSRGFYNSFGTHTESAQGSRWISVNDVQDGSSYGQPSVSTSRSNSYHMSTA